MLVLSRKEGERIYFGDRYIEILVKRIHGERVVLGITAPREVKVRRGELLEQWVERDKQENHYGQTKDCEEKDRHEKVGTA